MASWTWRGFPTNSEPEDGASLALSCRGARSFCTPSIPQCEQMSTHRMPMLNLRTVESGSARAGLASVAAHAL